MSTVSYCFWHAAAVGRQQEMKIPIPWASSISVGDLDREIKATQLASLGARKLAEAMLLFYDARTGEEYGGDDVRIPANASVVVRLLTMWSTVFQDSKRASSFKTIAAEVGRRREIDEAASASGRRRSSCTFWRFLKTPPDYVCRRCGVPGHYIQACPTNGDPRYDNQLGGRRRVLSGSTSTADGRESNSSTSPASNSMSSNSGGDCSISSGKSDQRCQFPLELLCPLCKQPMKGAVLTRCCFRSFCEECIQGRMASTSACACGATSSGTISADSLVPNKTLRETIARTLAASSTVTTEDMGGGPVSEAQSSLRVKKRTNDEKKAETEGSCSSREGPPKRPRSSSSGR